jgi:alpha-N-arabinofuranosidase
MHQGGQAVRTSFSAPPATFTVDGKPQALWGSRDRPHFHDRVLIVTVVNPHATEPRECAISVRGAAVADGRKTVLASSDLRAHNSFERPTALLPRDGAAAVRPGSFVHIFPPAAVTRLQLTLQA